ncbi:izumo sperm-egg fusion protein 1-like isoform X1 [Prionailurus iriomotensis]
MKMAASSFLRSVKLITHRGLRDDTFVKEFSAMLSREKETFRRNVARFHGDEDFCPNKCGVLLRLLRWCDSCLLHTYPCRKPTDCGVLTQRITAETTSKSSTFVTQPSNIGTQSPAIGTEAVEEIWDDLSPTLVPSECSNPEDVQTCLLIGAASLVLFPADHRIFHWRTLLSVWDGDRFHKVQIPHRQGSCSTRPASTELAVTGPAVT